EAWAECELALRLRSVSSESSCRSAPGSRRGCCVVEGSAAHRPPTPRLSPGRPSSWGPGCATCPTDGSRSASRSTWSRRCCEAASRSAVRSRSATPRSACGRWPASSYGFPELAARRSAEPAMVIGMPSPQPQPALGREFARLYREQFEFVWRMLLHFGVPPAGAEDAAQDVFMVVHRRWDDLDAHVSARSWLYG